MKYKKRKMNNFETFTDSSASDVESPYEQLEVPKE